MEEGALWEFWADKRIGNDGSAKPVSFVPECPCGPLPRRRLHRANRAGGRRIGSGLMHGLLAAQGWDLYDEETTRSLTAAQNMSVQAGNGVCACVCILTIPGKGRPRSLGASAEQRSVNL